MPQRPLRPCNKCGKLSKDGYCDAHRPQPWTRNKPINRVFKGDRLQRERQVLFMEQPLCVLCLKQGIDRMATERDHIIPLAEGGEDIRENTQALCKECHEKKTAREAKRGRVSGRI